MIEHVFRDNPEPFSNIKGKDRLYKHLIHL